MKQTAGDRIRKDDLRPGMRVRNTRTGQFGEVAKHGNDRFTRWAIAVHVLNQTGSRSNKTVIWKINNLEQA